MNTFLADALTIAVVIEAAALAVAGVLTALWRAGGSLVRTRSIASRLK